MALIVITIRDMDDGSCSVQLMDEPHCQEGQTEFTPAQHVGAAALNAIHAQLNAQPNIITPNRKQRRIITKLDS